MTYRAKTFNGALRIFKASLGHAALSVLRQLERKVRG